MTSRIDLIKAILRSSDANTRAELEKIPDEELVILKLKAEAKSASKDHRRFGKALVIGKKRNKLLRQEWKKKKR